MKHKRMTSKKPHLLNAFREWILENKMTPYLLVDANKRGVCVPQSYIKDGFIVLNISPDCELLDEQN